MEIGKYLITQDFISFAREWFQYLRHEPKWLYEALGFEIHWKVLKNREVSTLKV